MKTKIIVASLTTLLLQTTFAQITVPGTAEPWLAGMPNGTVSDSGDSAPAESPVLATGITIAGGADYYFSATGAESNDQNLGLYPLYGPDGNVSSSASHQTPENSMANLIVPLDALVGVFLTSTQPNLNPAPGPLDFYTTSSLNYLSLLPALQQPFYIGSGQTSSGIEQQVIAPAGATRLYLGVMDVSGWYNNVGSFTVNISAVPEPNMAGATAIVLAVLGIFSIINRKDKLTT